MRGYGKTTVVYQDNPSCYSPLPVSVDGRDSSGSESSEIKQITGLYFLCFHRLSRGSGSD